MVSSVESINGTIVPSRPRFVSVRSNLNHPAALEGSLATTARYVASASSWRPLRSNILPSPAVACAEISAGIGKRIKGEFGEGGTMVVGLANGSVGYVLDEEDYRSGGYEACMSFYGPKFGEFIIDQAGMTVDGLSKAAGEHGM